MFDLEQEIRRLNPIALAAQTFRLDGFFGRLHENLMAWDLQEPESVECFDNLGIAGATVADLYDRTATTCNQEAQAEPPVRPGRA